ncbi:hypothetical protein A5N15_11065 [Rothia kristinae]|uniref:NAD(P)-binding domain-containing protein n=1 Tax=Rothia kristinae TaxID=37923 RepID=A0A657ITH9_9MICC|nr:hypothetical protein A5N15_11065 [Rothia kristinae]
MIIAVTGPMKDRTFMQRSLPSILEAVRAAGAGRVVLTSVFGAGDTAQKASWFARGIYRTALRGFLADKEAADRLLIDSGLEHTIVYLVNLKDARRGRRPPSSLSMRWPPCRGCPPCPSMRPGPPCCGWPWTRMLPVSVC